MDLEELCRERGIAVDGGLIPVCEASETPLFRTLGAGVAAPECLSGYSAALSMSVFRSFASGGG